MHETDELAAGVHRLRLPRGPRLSHCTCVRRFAGRGRSVGLIVSPGSDEDLRVLEPYLTSWLGGPDGLHYVVLFEADPEMAMGAATLQQASSQPWIVCSRDTFRLARYHGLDVRRTIFMDDLPRGELTLPTGHRLQCLPVHHCPARGAAMLLDPEARLLFTGSLFATAELHEPLLGLRAWHEATMPSTSWLREAVARVAALRTSALTVVPTYGQTWAGDDLRDAFDLLSALEVGALGGDPTEDPHVDAAREVLTELTALLGESPSSDLIDDPSFPILRREAGVVTGFRISGALGLDVLGRAALSALPAASKGLMRRALLDIERLRGVTIAPARPTHRPVPLR